MDSFLVLFWFCSAAEQCSLQNAYFVTEVMIFCLMETSSEPQVKRKLTHIQSFLTTALGGFLNPKIKQNLWNLPYFKCSIQIFFLSDVKFHQTRNTCIVCSTA